MNYDDIINQPYRKSARKHMPPGERAAQFMPFAALTGFDARISETARLTDKRPSVCGTDAHDINSILNILISAAPKRVSLTFFVPDEKKPGGALIDFSGTVRWVDTAARRLVFADKTEIPIDDIFSLALEEQM